MRGLARGAESTQAIAKDPFGGESRKSRLQLRVNKRALSSRQSVLPVLHSGLRPRYGMYAPACTTRFINWANCAVLVASSVVFSLAILSALASYSSISYRGRKVLGSNSRSDHRHGAHTLGVCGRFALPWPHVFCWPVQIQVLLRLRLHRAIRERKFALKRPKRCQQFFLASRVVGNVERRCTRLRIGRHHIERGAQRVEVQIGKVNPFSCRFLHALQRLLGSLPFPGRTKGWRMLSKKMFWWVPE